MRGSPCASRRQKFVRVVARISSAVPTTAAHYDDAFVPADRRIGAEGQGLQIAFSALDSGRLGIAAVAVGFSGRGASLGYYHALNDYVVVGAVQCGGQMAATETA